MPRIPDTDSLGARPTPRFQRSVVSVRNRGSVAEAAGQFGATINQVAGQALEKQDKFNYAAAKASLLKADVEARTELQDDPDYGTFETRYNERMAKAKAAAGKLIQSNSDRGMFEADAGVDVARGLGQVKEAAHGKMVVAKKATLEQGLFDLQDVGQAALDEPTRAAAINSASEMIDGAVAQGILDPMEAGKAKRGFAQDYETRGIEGALDREDYTAARTLFERSRGRLDGQTESRIEGQLIAREQGREANTLADEYYSGPRSPVGIATPGQGAIVPSEPDKPRVLKPGESARVNKNWTGVATSVASTFGLNPVDMAAVMSYETGGTFSPTVMGGKGGNYMGLIQFGREERAKYGITAKSTPDEWTKAITGFLKDRGFKKGMGVMDLYSTINAGSPGHYDASDGNGTVRSHTSKLLSEHRGNAKRWLATGGVEVSQEYTNSEELPDVGGIYKQIDADAAAQGWTPEKVERVKTAVAKRVDRDRAVINQQENDAYDQAMAKSVDLADNFTDVSQLGPSFDRASPQQRNTLLNIAQANSRALEAEGNAATKAKVKQTNDLTSLKLDLFEQDNPHGFAASDLSKVLPNLSVEDRAKYIKRQATVAATLEKWNPYSQINGAVTRAAGLGGVKLKDQDKAAVREIMLGEAQRLHAGNGGKPISFNEYDQMFRNATRDVKTAGGVFSSGGMIPRYAVKPGDKATAEIKSSFKRINGREPEEDEIMSIYRRTYEQK